MEDREAGPFCRQTQSERTMAAREEFYRPIIAGNVEITVKLKVAPLNHHLRQYPARRSRADRGDTR